MAEKKASKANKGEPKTETPNPDNGKPEETSEALTRPSETSKYVQLFTAAQGDCVTKLNALIEKADDEDSLGLQKLIKSAKPVVKGREEMAAQWNIPTIRIVYGTTKDPSKPANAKPGEMYATNGRMIKAPFVFTPLYIFETNRMFQEGQNAPVCWSPDAKLGTMFGHCNRCTHQPLGKNPSGERTDCNNGVSMIVLAMDWKIYRMEFFKTSRKAGASVDRLVQSQDFLWERWFELTTAQVQSGGYEYYVFKTAAQGEDVGATAVQAADALYDLIKVERDAFLDKHYEQILSGGDGTSGTPSEESVDASAMGISPDVDTNPSDLAGGDL
jgi:hypothetical protein